MLWAMAVHTVGKAPTPTPNRDVFRHRCYRRHVNGHLGTTTSSARFKEAIEPMDKASKAIVPLKPVTFRCKIELDPDRIEQLRLVAEEVESRSGCP